MSKTVSFVKNVSTFQFGFNRQTMFKETCACRLAAASAPPTLVPDHAAVLQRGRLRAVHHGLGRPLGSFIPGFSGQTEQRPHPLRLHIQDGVRVPHLLQVPVGAEQTTPLTARPPQPSSLVVRDAVRTNAAT